MAFPLFPGMLEVNHSTNSGFGKASMGKSFRSSSSYDDVKRFYSDRLIQDGWKLVSERHLKDWGNDVGGRELDFQRGDYEITIQYAGEKADYGWDYGLDIGWRHY